MTEELYRIVHDDDCASPRENCNLGTFWTFHRRYNSPDPDPQPAPPKDAIALTVYMYDHSGVTYSTTPFHCPWDSGPVGFIWAHKPDDMSEEQVRAVLEAEVEEYSKWAEGDCWGYELLDGSEDSCWGLIGREWAEQAAQEALA